MSKKSHLKTCVLLSLLVFVGGGGGAPSPPPALSYTITILPLLSGTTEASATAINTAGTVVGYSQIENPDLLTALEATLWQDGVPSDLGSGVATAINANNQVAGYTPDNQAWFWSQSTGRIMIGVLPGLGFDSSLAQGIDADGTVVGQSYLESSGAQEGFTWRMDTGLQPVQSLQEIFAVNNGSMAGMGTNGQAAIVNQAMITSLGTLGGTFTVATGINGSGHACGWGADSTGATHAFFWKHSIADLGTDHTAYSFAFGVNDSDQVVGQIGDSSGMVQSRARLRGWGPAFPRTIHATDRAMIWTKATGIVGLKSTAVVSPDWTLSVANAINGKGEIVGTAFNQALLNQRFHSGA